MPFTLAHAAAALPLRRTRLVWSALVIGTFAPDLEYFILLSPDNRYGHTLTGAILLSLPLALLTLWLFHRFVKAPLIDLLPECIRGRLDSNRSEFHFLGPVRFLWIVVSILLGIATHVLWDSFTHANTFFYRHWQTLREPIRVPVLRMIPLYKLLQHGSTIFGLAALSIWFLLWYRKNQVSTFHGTRNRMSTPQKVWLLTVITTVASLGAALRSIATIGIPSSQSTVKQAIGLFVVTCIAAMWWELVLYGVARTRLLARTSGPSSTG
jgi:hypothetical protein